MSETGERAARTLSDDWARLRDEVAGAVGDAREFVGDQVDAHPLLAVGTAAGLGFLLGGGVTRHSLALLVGVGARLAAQVLSDEFAGALERAPDRGHTD